MNNMFLYYKYIIRVQFLLKYPAKKINNLIINILKKVLFEVNFDDLTLVDNINPFSQSVL